jgi:hypothetical protein
MAAVQTKIVGRTPTVLPGDKCERQPARVPHRSGRGLIGQPGRVAPRGAKRARIGRLPRLLSSAVGSELGQNSPTKAVLLCLSRVPGAMEERGPACH